MNLNIRKSLRMKLLVSFILLSFLPALFIGIYTQVYSRTQQRETINAEIREINLTKEQQIQSYLEEQVLDARRFAENITIQRAADEISRALEAGDAGETSDGYVMSLRQLISGSAFSHMTILCRSDGKLLYDSNTDPEQAGTAVTSMGTAFREEQNLWEEVRTSSSPVMHDAVYNREGGYLSISIGVPLFDRDNEFTHVLILGFTQETIDTITGFDISEYRSRETFLLNSEDRVISNPAAQAESRSLGSLYRPEHLGKALASGSFHDSITDSESGKRIILSVDPVEVTEIDGVRSDFTWHIVTRLDEAEFLAPLNRSAWLTALVILLVSFAAAGIAFIISGHIVTPVLSLNDEVSRLAEGHLDFEADFKREDEIGTLLKNTEYMVTQIRKIVTAISETVERTNEAGSAIAASVEEQSAISVEQSGSITEISSTMDEFTSSFNQVSENIDSVAELMDKIYEHTSESSGLIDSVSEKMQDINADNDRDISNIMELKQRSKEISKVMEIIHDISDQTKIIAFNAALEASSAGEAGKRFGVVAAEIRKLTENVIDSTDSIDTIITEIQNLADQMVLASEKTTKNIQSGLSYSADSVENFNTIVGHIKASTEASKQIVLSVQQQRSAAGQIQTGLKELSVGAQQNSEAIQEINKSGTAFKQISRQLSLLIKRFHLGSGDETHRKS